MPKLEVFFDYICPYCLLGHEYLLELLPQYPGHEIEWRPCESHPRPEQHGRHSDLCARGMFFALEQGADLIEYHRRVYQAALTERANVEDLNVMLAATEGLLDQKKLREALAGNQYVDRLLENNQLAWVQYDFPAVPSYRLNGELLKSTPGVGVSKEQLAAFLGRP